MARFGSTTAARDISTSPNGKRQPAPLTCGWAGVVITGRCGLCGLVVVDRQLVGVVDVTFAAIAEALLQQFSVGQLQLFVLLRQLLELLLLFLTLDAFLRVALPKRLRSGRLWRDRLG